MSILKGALGGIGAGMGAMALLNEEKGGTFTSYPEPSRLKQLMGQDISRPETWGGSGENIWGDKYGKAAEDNDDIDWIETTYDGKTYEFANTPHAHQIMMDNGPFHMKETVDELVEVGLMRLIEDDSSPFTKDLPQGDTMMPEDFAPMKEPDEFMGVPTEGLKRY